jgi:hypothetical protein
MYRSHLLALFCVPVLLLIAGVASAATVIDGYAYASGGGPSCGATPLIVDGQSYTASTTLCVPQDVTSLKIEAWGAGSAGAGRTTAGGGGGGGGGAKATRTAKSVSFGDTISITVGAANTAGTGIPSGTAGGTSVDGCTAGGGGSPTGTNGITGGAAGTASGCDTNQSGTAGSNGGNTSGNNGGAGGAGGTTGGGAGGAAQSTANSAGHAGTAPGGGGGGSKRTTTGSPVGGAGSAGRVVFTFDTTPDSFSFTDQTGVTASTLTSSDVQQITGLGAPASVTVSGTGSPEFQICADSGCSSVLVAWGTSSQTIYNNQYLQLRLTSSAAAGGTASATLTVGTASSVWTVQTEGTPSGVFETFEGAPLTGDRTWTKDLTNLGAPVGAQTVTVTSSTSNVTQGAHSWRLQGTASTSSIPGIIDASPVDLSGFTSVSIDITAAATPDNTEYVFGASDGTVGSWLYSSAATSAGFTGSTTLTLDLTSYSGDLTAVYLFMLPNTVSGSGSVDYYIDNLIAN